ncbi:hypothetical protein [Flavivirga sp. 57AJ16]|uniref:hypothetical protein n=1 Tax=Flavivirga sp. 57AJ16 TaxID=3025307 RepID=UPI0023652D82|nr:hypothetical protein [Flavivirga sp. 57AJ16]MDD7885741.1 hypothetical protein [Flavivirga sp. 57AJ16]
MIDTIVLRFHGVLDKKTDTLSEVKSGNSQAAIYAVDEHHELYKKMLRYEGKFFNMVQRVNKDIISITPESDSEFFDKENNAKNVGYQYVKNVMRFIDEDLVKETIGATNGKFNSPNIVRDLNKINSSFNQKKRVPSSISAVVFKINHNGGFIDFNLSIPKYLYGHSLAEFVPQPLSRTYFNAGVFNLELIKNQRKIIYKRLMKFIDRFLNDMAHLFKLEVIPNKKFIEIRRIDLCYNQYFESKTDALNYLEHLKKRAKKKAINSNKELDTYKTSITYFKSLGSYFKIYHKGSEYVGTEHGDYKKHSEFNRNYIDHFLRENDVFEKYRFKTKYKDLCLKLFDDDLKGNPINVQKSIKDDVNVTARILKRIQPFKTDFLKAEMDKVLRYEMSLSGAFFSYQYKMHVFRNKKFKMKNENGFYRDYDCCPIYRELKENYKYVKGIYKSELKDDDTVKKFEHREYKIFKDFLNRKICLVLNDSPKDIWLTKSTSYTDQKFKKTKKIQLLDYKHTLLSTKDVGIFCDDFLQRCFDYFFDTVKDFKIKKLETYDTIAEKISAYNSKVDERVNLYNAVNKLKTVDNRGNRIIKGNRVITRATQLLTQKEKRDLKLKKVDPLRLLQILREMQNSKVSLPQIREKLNLSRSTYSRLLADLRLFNVFEESLELEKPIFTEISYRQYYHNTKGMQYQNNFYRKEEYKRYG